MSRKGPETQPASEVSSASGHQEGAQEWHPLGRRQRKQSSLRKDVATETGVPYKHVAVQVSGCSERQSLSAMLGGGCLRCGQVDALLCMVPELPEGVERLRQSEEEIDWWSCT